MKMYKLSHLLLASLVAGIFGCTTILDEPKTAIDTNPDITEEVSDPAVVPFDFATTVERTVSLITLDNGDKPLSGIVLTYGYLLEEEYHMVGKGITDSNGALALNLNLATAVDYLVVKTDYIGLPDQVVFDLNDQAGSYTIGGKSDYVAGPAATNGRILDGTFSENGFYLRSTYDDKGVPHNLLPVDDYIPQDMLDLINSSLPETKPVPEHNPQYLEDDLNLDTWLKDSAEVWITFVHEGAGWTNTLGYYTYDLDNPPSSREDIDSLFILFPNVSYNKSGGGLKGGNKIKIGNFSANTGIGWFLLPQGWSNNREVRERAGIKFSNKSLNTFVEKAYSQHTVLLHDKARELFLLGFEDTTRPGGDNDFNDAVFYVSATPYEAVITDKMETTQTDGSEDTDGDGVSDHNDDYPDDPERAFNIFYPGKNVYGSLAFEDQWPFKGDYDMNDVVVDYNFQFVTNTANRAVSLSPKLKFRAAGATYHNGFAINFPFAESLIGTISGDVYNGNAIELRANFTEANNSDNTVIITDDIHALMGGEGQINTMEGGTSLPVKEVELKISFAQPAAMNTLGFAPFNPFIFIDNDRTREVHLADHKPTAVADMSHFNTGHDLSAPAQGFYYKSYQLVPWAINIPVSFDYPQEFKPVNEAYLKYVQWAQSGGQEFKDWYSDKSGYRNQALIKN